MICIRRNPSDKSVKLTARLVVGKRDLVADVEDAHAEDAHAEEVEIRFAQKGLSR